MTSTQRNPPKILYRRKCQILAALDLIWRIGDMSYATMKIFSPKNDAQKSKEIPENEPIFSYDVIKVMDDRVYDFLFSPFLTLIYFIGFFLQVSSSIFLCKSCTEKSIPENERAACKIWSRIGIVSMIILLIRFFLPYVVLSIFNVTYNCVRVLFKLTGIFIVLKHAQEMDILILFLDPEYFTTTKRSRIESSTASFSHSEDYPSTSMRKTSHTVSHSGSKASDEVTYENNQSFVRPRAHRALLLLEKDMYDQALNELKIAQSYANDDPNVAIMLNIVEKIIRIINTPDKDYYKILGVSKTNSLDDIKRAYRKKSLRHHPDKHFTAGEKVQTRETKLYQEIREAYDILSDTRRRSFYDDKSTKDKEVLTEHKRIFKNVYATFVDSQSQYTSSIV